MYVTIERLSPDGLTREGWRFVFLESYSALILDAYTSEDRYSKRHKWICVKRYERVLSRSSTLAESEVPYDSELQNEARRLLNEKLRVVKWSEVKHT